MSLRTSATRYARALLDVAAKEADPVAVGQQLDAIVGLVQENRELRHALTSADVAAAGRVGVMRAVVERSGFAAPLGKLLMLLADRGRLDLLPLLRDVYRERLLQHQNIVQATVTSATPLSADAVNALTQRLSTVTGKRIELDTAVDPALIGGLVTRIGSTVYDGSVRTQLQKMKQQLVENA